jgi:glucose-1-phosphate adenylyltransferase
MNMTGIIFSNIYDTYMGDLTKHRTLASVPFGGRYRLIDFVLSNMSNSDIINVGIITKYNYQSLMDHLGSCSEWDLNRKNGRVFILPPFGTGQTSVYQGKLEALHGALQFLKRSKTEYILMSDTNVICNIDYEIVLKEHINSGAKVTVIANREEPRDEDDIRDLVLTEEDGKVTDIAIRHPFTKENLCGMGMFIIARDLLIEAVEEGVSHGLYHFERDFLQKEFLKGNLDVNVYEFKRSVLRNRDIPSYLQNHFRLIEEEEVRNDVFDPQNPIYTKVRDEAPTYYDSEANVNDCLIADGCRIEGSIRDSVIFRDVTIEKGAMVDHAIVMQGTVIKSGANIKYAIIDKDVEITEDRTLIGSEKAPVIIQKGEKI